MLPPPCNPGACLHNRPPTLPLHPFPQSPQQEQDAASSSQKQQAAEAGSGNAEQASTSGAGPSAEELGRKVFGSFKSGFESVKSKIGDASASGPAPSHLFESLSKEVRAVFLPDDTIRSATRKYTGPVMDTQAEGYAGTSALAVVKQEQTAWDKVKEKVGRRRCMHGRRMHARTAYTAACAWAQAGLHTQQKEPGAGTHG